MREPDEEIETIRKEIIESRGLMIKTNNLVNSLGADIKSIAKRQAGYERRFNWNSAVAYLLFAAISFVGLKLASDARIGEIQSETDDLKVQVKELQQELSEEIRRADERAAAETRASRFYDLIRSRKKSDAIEQYEALIKQPLSPAEALMFRDIIDQFRMDLSLASYQTGLGLMRTGRYAEAFERFQKSLSLKDKGSHVPEVKYELARSLLKLGRAKEAQKYAEQVVEQNIKKELQVHGLWLLSYCAEKSENLDLAYSTLRTLLRRWPRSSYAAEARERVRDLRLLMRKQRKSKSG